MNPAIAAAGANAAGKAAKGAGKAAASAAKTGFDFAVKRPKHLIGGALIIYGIYKALPIRDFVPLPDVLIGNSAGNKLENALVGGACICVGLALLSK